MKLREQIKEYIPYNEQEEKDKQLMLKWIDSFEDMLTRKNEFAHFVTSAWVVNEKKDKILMIYHNIYNSWSWIGGHADGEENLLEVATREVKEETGVKQVTPISDEILSLEIGTVNGHRKHGKYVSSHLHLNLTFLLEVSEKEELRIKEDENSGVQWMTIEQVKKIHESDFIDTIYRKIIRKMEEKYKV